jgi:hypothetical protein
MERGDLPLRRRAGRVRAAGAHGLDVAMFGLVHVTVESAPLRPRRAHEDRVIDVVTDLDREVPPAYAGQLPDRRRSAPLWSRAVAGSVSAWAPAAGAARAVCRV